MSFKGGIKTKGTHKKVKRITSARSRSKSFEKFLISILFFGMGIFMVSLGKGRKAKGKWLRAKGFRACRYQINFEFGSILKLKLKLDNYFLC